MERVRISSTFSVLRPFYFERFTWARFLRYFVKSGFGQILLVQKYMSKYSFGRNKVSGEVKFGQKIEVKFKSK